MSREDEHNYDARDNVAVNLGTKSELAHQLSWAVMRSQHEIVSV